MKNNAGIWIDNKNAIIIFVSGKRIEKILVKPNNRKVMAFEDDFGQDYFLPDFGQVFPEDSPGPDFSKHPVGRFYHDVMKAVRRAESIFIVGNGGPMQLLKQVLEQNNLGGRISGTETSEKLLFRQLATRVQNYFNDVKKRN